MSKINSVRSCTPFSQLTCLTVGLFYQYNFWKLSQVRPQSVVPDLGQPFPTDGLLLWAYWISCCIFLNNSPSLPKDWRLLLPTSLIIITNCHWTIDCTHSKVKQSSCRKLGTSSLESNLTFWLASFFFLFLI